MLTTAWRSGKRAWLITRRSQDRNLALLWVTCSYPSKWNYTSSLPHWRSWITRETSNLKIAGSSPAWGYSASRQVTNTTFDSWVVHFQTFGARCLPNGSVDLSAASSSTVNTRGADDDCSDVRAADSQGDSSFEQSKNAVNRICVACTT